MNNNKEKKNRNETELPKERDQAKQNDKLTLIKNQQKHLQNDNKN